MTASDRFTYPTGRGFISAVICKDGKRRTVAEMVHGADRVHIDGGTCLQYRWVTPLAAIKRPKKKREGRKW